MVLSSREAALSSFAARFSVGSQLVFKLECDDSVRGSGDAQAQLAAQLGLLREHLTNLLTPPSSFGQRLLQDAKFFHHMLDVEDGSVCSVTLASKLLGVGYRHVTLRRAEGGGPGSECFHNLRNSFLVVQGEGVDEGINFIVEPNFRSHFEISNPTPRYCGLLDMLPALLVASPAQLRPLVQLLFSEMSLAFEQQGLSLPPWRQSKSLLSKWLPSKARDVDLSPFASPRAASPEPDFFALTLCASSSQPLQPLEPANTSGSLTPGYSNNWDDASPRAVLSSASAVLSSHSAVANAAAAAAALPGCPTPSGPVALKPKSLLSTSLAAAGGGASRTSSTSSSQYQPATGATAASRQQAQPTVHVAASGLTYTVAPSWQEPPIRTVKMQGAGRRAQA